MEAVPLRNIEATTCADAFISGWLSRFGVPATVSTDRGTQFCSATWSGMCHRLGIQHITTTAYHPQSNGMVERVHRQLKDSLRARLAGPQWLEHLPWVLLGIRSAPKEDSSVSSAELVLGVPFILPSQLSSDKEVPQQQVLKALRSLKPPATRPLTYAQAAASLPASLFTADFVYIRRGGVAPPLAPVYMGPYKVLDRSEKVFQVLIGGRSEAVSVDRIKPHLGTSPVLPATPPLRGRPPRPAPAVPVSASSSSSAASTGGGPCSGLERPTGSRRNPGSGTG